MLHELLKITLSDLMNIRQHTEEKIKAFSVRLKDAARKCGFNRKILDNMCFNYLKKCALRHIFTLSRTSFDIALEYAIWFKRNKKLEVDKKNKKRKGEVIDKIDEEDTEQSNSKIKRPKQE